VCRRAIMRTTTTVWLASLALTIWVSAGCARDEVEIGAVGALDYQGRVERIETLGRYSTLDATLLFQFAGARAKVATEDDYYLYRVVYPTADVHGGTTTVSGLVAVPATRDIKGVVSWQHGTNTYRHDSISEPSLPEGLGTAGVFGGDGFIMVAADYIGLGVSTEPQAYYDWPSTVSTVTDLISIAEIMLDGIARAPRLDLYLAGFSQGGGATAAVQRSLEQNNSTGLQLRGAAAISAAFNPLAVSMPHVIESNDTLSMALFATSFSQLYGQPLSDVIQAPYDSLLPGWFDGTKDQDFLSANLPTRVDQLVTAGFLSGYEAGTQAPQWFYDGLTAAATSDYAPRAPLRIYYGDQDTVVIPKEAEAAFTGMQALGGDVELVDLGAYDHDNIVVAALPNIQQWFDALAGQAP